MKDLFAKYQQPLLKLVNHPLGKKYIGFLPKEKIVGLTSTAFAIEKGNKIEATLRSKPVFQNKLKLALSGLSAYENILDGIKYYLEPKQIEQLAYVTFNKDLELPSNTGGDGYTQAGGTSAWATHRDAATGSYADSAATTFPVAADKDSGNYTIRRGLIPILSTALDGITVDSAILKIYANSNNDADGCSIVLAISTQASGTAVVTADYSKITKNTPTELASRVTVSTMSTVAYTEMELNAAGIIAIDAAGYTKYSLRNSRDVDNLAPSAINRPYIYTTNETGTDKDPILVVTYTPAGGGAFLMNFIS